MPGPPATPGAAATSALPAAERAARPWQRLHAALMPDYNRRAAACWWSMVVAGFVLLGSFVLTLAGREPQVWLHVAVGMALAMLAGLFPVRIPGTRHSFVASDVFIFLLLLMHGTAAAAVAVAGEAFMGSLRSSKRWTSRIASPAIGTLALAVAGGLFEAARGALGLPAGPATATAVQPWPGTDGVALLMALAMVAGLLYFLLSASLFAGLLRVKRDEPFFQLADVVSVFRWVGLAYAGSAALATLLLMAYWLAGVGVWVVMLPLLAMLLVTLHFYFRQQESAEALRERTAEAEAREAEAASRHLRELQASEGRFHGAFTHAAIGMALLGFDGRILQANGALGALLGCDAAALPRRNLGEFVAGEHGEVLRSRLADAAVGRFDHAAVEMRFAVDGGEAEHRDAAVAAATTAARREVWAALHIAAFTEGGSAAPCLIVQAQDITGRRVAEQQLHQLAFHDTLTGLPNRRRFMQCLEGAVARALADPQYGYAVMYLDFDRFKRVNDSLGHGAGDALLVQLARRLQARLRPSDVVARLGGDEFALLTERGHGHDRPGAHERDVHALAERLLEALHAPFEVAGQELQVSASIGITFGSLGYLRAEEVLRDADTAMYKAKAEGRARIVHFDASLHADVSRRLRMEGDLRRAIEQGLLSVAYQPVFELQPGQPLERGSLRPSPRLSPRQGGGLRAVEALVRWRHPTEGLLAPAAFLPIAEESGLMPRLSDFVLHTACRQVRAWQQSHPAWAELSLSVNVAAQDLAEPGYATRVQAALLASGLRGEHLTVELTENTLMARVEGVVATLTELRRLGVRVAVDDFGTGYSSLSYLARLPIDELKIDRSFVSHLAGEGDPAAVVRAIVHLGQSLRKAIVAEGIESSRQLEQLLALGCQLGQGHLLAEPLDAAATGELLVRMRAGGNATGALHLH